TAALRDYIAEHPDRAIARLLCPRRLRPGQDYLVCLVPTFEVGRLVGLGKTPDETTLKPAWTFNSTSHERVVLPIYDLWRFRTGATGDFESVAATLSPYQYTEEMATQRFAVDPLLGDATLPLAGALRPVVDNRVSEPVPVPVKETLTDWLNRSATIEETGGDPQVTPPIYGRWQAAQRRVGVPGTPAWADELNLDPRHRLAAAAGGDVVQRHQDEFVQAAWQQTGQLSEANMLLRQGQMASWVNDRLQSRHFQRLPDDLLLQVAGPTQARIRTQGSQNTLYKTVEESSIPEACFEGAFRRLTRSRGPHLRRALSSTDDALNNDLFHQGYQTLPILSGEVRDDGTLEAPSRWTTRTRGSLNIITAATQHSNINSLPHDPAVVDKPGTLFLIGDANWKDLKFRLQMKSPDNDAMGVVFRYRNERNFYRFSMDSQRRYRRLVRCVNNQFTVLWQDDFSYEPDRNYGFKVEVEGDRIQILFGTLGNFNLKKLIDLRDDRIQSGRVGLYTWGNKPTEFTNLGLQVNLGFGAKDFLGNNIVDEGNVAAPSAWKVEEGILKQTRNIHSLPKDRDVLPKRGTYLTLGESRWDDYSVEAAIATRDDDAIGIMFRYRNERNFYRFSMDLERSYQRLVKCVDGQFTLLWQRDEGFDNTLFHAGSRVKIIADGSRLMGFLARSKIFDVRDRSHTRGKVALYCWGIPDVEFRHVRVRRLHRDRLLNRLNLGFLQGDLPSPLEMTALRDSFLAETSGQQVVSARLRDRINRVSGHAPIHPAPEIPQPLAPKLIEQASYLLLPGMQSVPENAVALLETNPAFVTSFLVGANHEMSRELLWRGLNSELRGTVFRQFWDVRGGSHRNDTPSQREAHKDIRPIHQWGANEKLADQINQGTSSRCVFLVRSELVRRFPTANYYLAQAQATRNGRKPTKTTQAPLFRGQLGADMAFFGFDLSAAEVRGDNGAGWYFVVEQPPFKTRFGLDVVGEVYQDDENLPDWSDLAWNHINKGAAYVHPDALVPLPPTDSNLPQWSQNSAHMAAIALQKPVRIFIHADR
ncbi:MAG: hypothetical protein AAF921_28115, partial [Cyanobacteria bacterium P01_D01_bin.44]